MELDKQTQLSWRKFLSTEVGVKGELFLRAGVPAIPRGPEHEIVFDAGKVEGYQLCLKRLTDLLAIQPKEKAEKADND